MDDAVTLLAGGAGGAGQAGVSIPDDQMVLRQFEAKLAIDGETRIALPANAFALMATVPGGVAALTSNTPMRLLEAQEPAEKKRRPDSVGNDSGSQQSSRGAGSLISPVAISPPSVVPVLQVACGGAHTLVLTATGTSSVFSFGSNEFGQLGRSTGRERRPGRIAALEALPQSGQVVGIAAGGKHSVAWLGDSGALVTWGDNSEGQLAHGDRENRTKPTIVADMTSQSAAFRSTSSASRRGASRHAARQHAVVFASCGDQHTLVVTRHGEVFAAGRNREGQLGLGDTEQRRWLTPLASLWGKPVAGASCGFQHSVVTTIGGAVLCFGSNNLGQSGFIPTRARFISLPTLVPGSLDLRIITAVCGHSHSIALTSRGELFSWGSNSHGECGHMLEDGDSFSAVDMTNGAAIVASPAFVQSLKDRSLRVSSVAAGARFSLCIASPRFGHSAPAVFGWGESACGSLGLPGVGNVFVPMPVSFASHGVQPTDRKLLPATATDSDIMMENSAALSAPLDLVTPLAVMAGATGSQSFVAIDGPKAPESTQHVAINIARLSLADTRKLLDAGDLSGLRELLMTVFTSPGCLATSFLLNTPSVLAGHGRREYLSPCEHESGLDFYAVREAFSLIVRTDGLIDALRKAAAAALVSVSHTAERGAKDILDAFTIVTGPPRAGGAGGVPLICSAEALRSILILLENPLLIRHTKDSIPLAERLVEVFHYVMTHVPGAKDYVRAWWRVMPATFFARHVQVLTAFLASCLEFGIDSTHVVSSCSLLNELFLLNNEQIQRRAAPRLHECRHKERQQSVLRVGDLLTRIPNEIFSSKSVSRKFENPTTSEDWAAVLHDYTAFRTSPNVFSFLNFPFLLTPAAKNTLFSADASLQMRASVVQAQLGAEVQAHAQRLLDLIQTRSANVEEIQRVVREYEEQRQLASSLTLMVDRESLVRDTRLQILGMLNSAQQVRAAAAAATDAQQRADDRAAVEKVIPVAVFKRPLKVVFWGEEGADLGGVQREFFQLLFQQLLGSTEHPLFVAHSESQLLWINNELPDDDLDSYTVVGILMGLALFNGVVVGDGFVRFAPIFFKRLLAANRTFLHRSSSESIHNYRPTLSDLRATHPDIAVSFERLLEYDGDVESDVGINWTVSLPGKNHTVVTELMPGGADIPVTNENREEYVRAYMYYLLVTSVTRKWNALARGFLSVAGGAVLEMCTWQDLELILFGRDTPPSMEELEQHTTYKGGYSSEHPTVRMFWEVVREFSVPQRRELLAFATGSGRVPVRGLQALNFVIQRNGDSQEQLPGSYTCFSTLLLPEYQTKEVLRSKLERAIELGGKGFGVQ